MATIDRRGLKVDGSSPSSSDTPDVALAIKLAVRVASTVHLTLAGLRTVDGVSLIEGHRVLAKNQTDATQNGIYVVSSGNWTRSVDFDASAEIASGVIVMASAGTIGAQTMHQLTTADPIVLGTSHLTWAVVSGETGPQGIQGPQGDPGDQGPQGDEGAPGISGTSAVTRIRVIDTAGLDPTTAYESGDTVNGVVLAANDLVLRAKTVADAANGVYVVPASGAAPRHPDFAAYDSLPGTLFSVMEGTVKADTLWVCTSDRGGTIGVTAIVVEEFSGGGGVWSNTRLAKTAAYTVANGNKGNTIALAGAAYYALTFSAASGYDADFAVTVLNEDTRAKSIVLTGGATFKLWPSQSVVVYNSNNAWRTVGQSLYYIPVGFRLYVDHALGNNNNDGLAAGAGNALATIQKAIQICEREIDCNGTGPTIQVDSTSFTENNVIHTYRIRGYHVIYIVGDHTTPANRVWNIGAGQTGLQARDWSGLIIDGFKFVAAGAGTTGISCSQHGIVDIWNVEWGTFTGGVHIQSTNGGSIGYAAGFVESITGAFAQHWNVSTGSNLICTGGTIEIPSALAFAAFLVMSGGVATTAGITMSGAGNGAGSTGTKYVVNHNGFYNRNGVTLPGATAGTPASGVTGATGGQVS